MFNYNSEYDVLVTNPHTLAESVSLHNVCHDAIKKTQLNMILICVSRINEKNNYNHFHPAHGQSIFPINFFSDIPKEFMDYL